MMAHFSSATNFKKRGVAVRRFALAFAAAAIALGTGFSSSVFAQGRTIEDTLVVSDPTVAARGKWRVGAAVEYWQTHSEFDVFLSATEFGTATLDFKQTGFNLFVAYGNWTVQATSRTGEGDYSADITTGCCGRVLFSGPQKTTDDELTLRYLWPTRSVSPYVLLGYTTTKINQTETITSGVAVWSCTSTKTRETKTEYTGPLLGGGMVVPFSQRFGMRTDLRLKYYSGKYDQTGTTSACQHDTGHGLGYDFTLTGYWNIVAGLNFQLGAKSQWLNGGEGVPDSYKLGFFGMLGYSHQF